MLFIFGLVGLLALMAWALFSNVFSVILFVPKLAFDVVTTIFKFAKFIFPQTWMGFYLWCFVVAQAALVVLSLYFPIMKKVLKVIFHQNLVLVSWALVAYRMIFSSPSLSSPDSSFDAWNRVVFPLEFCVFHEAWSLVGSKLVDVPSVYSLVKLFSKILAPPVFVVASLIVRLRVKCLVHRLLWYAGCCKIPPLSYAAATADLNNFFKSSAEVGLGFKAWPNTKFYDSACRVWLMWAFVNGARSCEHHANMSLLIALWTADVFLSKLDELMPLWAKIWALVKNKFRTPSSASTSPSVRNSEQRLKAFLSTLKIAALVLLLAIKRLEFFFVAQQRQCGTSTTVTFFDFSDVRYVMGQLFAAASEPLALPLSAMSRRCIVLLSVLTLYTGAKLGNVLMNQFGPTSIGDIEQKKKRN